MRYLRKKRVSTNASDTIPNPNSQLMLSAESNEDDTFGELLSMSPLPSLTSYELASHGEDASWVGKTAASIVSGVVKPLQDWHTANLTKQAYHNVYQQHDIQYTVAVYVRQGKDNLRLIKMCLQGFY